MSRSGYQQKHLLHLCPSYRGLVRWGLGVLAECVIVRGKESKATRRGLFIWRMDKPHLGASHIQPQSRVVRALTRMRPHHNRNIEKYENSLEKKFRATELFCPPDNFQLSSQNRLHHFTETVRKSPLSILFRTWPCFLGFSAPEGKMN